MLIPVASSGQFVPSGGGVVTLSQEVALQRVTDDGSTAYTDFTHSGINLAAGDKIIGVGIWINRFVSFVPTLEIDGVAADARIVNGHVFNNAFTAIFRHNVASPLTGVDVVIAGFSSSTDNGCGFIEVVDAANYTGIRDFDETAANASTKQTTLDVAEGGAVYSICQSQPPIRSGWSWSAGITTSHGVINGYSGSRACYAGRSDSLSADAAYDLDLDFNGVATQGSLCSVSIE